jgi:hypothetical protein
MVFVVVTFGFSSKEAKAAGSIEVQGYSIQDAVGEVSDNLPWSKESITGARTLIVAERAKLLESLKTLKASGAARVEVINAPFAEVEINRFLKQKDRIRRFSIRGFSDSGVVVGTEGPFPEFARQFGESGVRLKDPSCRLQGWNLFIISSWLAPRCEIVSITPKHYLNLSLIGTLVTAEVEGYYHFKIGQLEELEKTSATCRIAKEQVLCAGSSIGSPKLLAKNRAAIGGYAVSIDPTDGHLIFTKTPPDVRRLAEAAGFDARLQVVYFN